MANVLKEHKIIDTQNRSLVKYVWISDGTAESNTTLIDVSALAYSLNANSVIMVGGADPKPSYKTTIRRIYGTVKANTYIALQWYGLNGLANDEIVTINSGNFDLRPDYPGHPGTLPNPNVGDPANTNGDIVFSVPTPNEGDNFTLIFDIKKDNHDYDAGQTADPSAFNRGVSAGPL
tara:strand:+ start:436 stop:966 length:531 start_codon:yes stop_codon:yes gene_type:complete